MSYARWGCDGSDVYVYPSSLDDGETRVIVCMSCKLIAEDSDVVCTAAELMIRHLEAHRAAGHTVPEYAFERLRSEQKQQEEEKNGRDEGT